MSTTREILGSAEAEICRPALRHILQHAGWTALAQASITQSWTLLAHWADTTQAHALFLDPEALTIVPISTPVIEGSYPALSPILPGAAWYERMIHDLWGHEAAGAEDLRPWLDHGTWPYMHPMSLRPKPSRGGEPPELFETDIDANGDSLMVLPLGPLWGRLDEAAHLRLTLRGPSIRRAESLLGFNHRGILTLLRGKSPRAAARFAARLCGDATVAHSIAFAQATEAAMDVAAAPRAAILRIVMLEVERIAGHLDNLAEVARLSDAPMIQARSGALREVLLRATDSAFGHRLMMDCVMPGGMAADIADSGPRIILQALGHIASELKVIRRLHQRPALESRLTGLGRTDGRLAAALGTGGIVGRAGGRGFDTRSAFSPGHLGLAPRFAIRTEADAASRQQLRMFEIEESLRLVSTALDTLPAGPVMVTLPQLSGEGIGCAESVRGDVWHWLRFDRGQIAAAFVRDPGWALWPLAERALEQAAAEDTGLLRASFALPASGMDL